MPYILNVEAQLHRTYAIEGISCSGCVKAIEQVLTEIPKLKVVEISQDPAQVTLEMPSGTPLQQLNQALSVAGDYKLSGNPPDHEEAQSAYSYRPLILIFSFLTLAVTLEQWGLINIDIPLALKHFMGGFFLIFSFFKFLDLKGFAAAYGGYDIIAKKFPTYGSLYPFLELILGIYFLSPLVIPAFLWFTLILMSISTAGVIKSLYSKKQIRCACLGTVFNLPMSTVTLVEDLLMVAMSGGMLLYS